MKEYTQRILTTLSFLRKNHPHIPMGRHLYTLSQEYDLFSISDRNLYQALQRYANQLSLDVPHSEDIDTIIKDGLNLSYSDILQDPEDERYG